MMQRMMEEETLKRLGGKSGGWGEADARAVVISTFTSQKKQLATMS